MSLFHNILETALVRFISALVYSHQYNRLKSRSGQFETIAASAPWRLRGRFAKVTSSHCSSPSVKPEGSDRYLAFEESVLIGMSALWEVETFGARADNMNCS
ncbi:hypothetical protein R1flu_018688 [Riccia fluitans]|uniref:Uncharacterized protein n=1 Tax=Riccia fluitans TaxID=41844 RepID=A0ABD1ZGW7_9MARC